MTTASPTRVPRVRHDALPETTIYRDTGCSLSPSCLRCPYPSCRHDHISGTRAFTIQQRLSVLRLLANHPAYTRATIAAQLGVSRRQVYRYLRTLTDADN